MGFGEITEVVPWDILASDCGQRLEDDQVCEPRLFKSHESASDIARGARYVCVVRDPMDVFHSFYHFLPPYMGIPHGAVTREAFADAVFAGASHSGQCWDHFLGWWDRRHEPETLIVCFEDMKENLEKVARRVALHLFPPGPGGSAAADLGEAALAGACERSGFEAMRRDASKFDDHFVRRKMWTRVGIDESEWAPAGGAHVGKVREGGGAVGRGREASSPELRRRIDARWDDVMRPRGFETYAAFRAAIEAHNAERDAKAGSAGERE
jgi:aryl sulfotransferase